ncbi:heterokaryon incompatibility protein-domain-containing protein [Cadophora sp. MPI-SDFR-AT-0126]|nr:heterokaryon incompatibility protein-domain-containing protein [Leotiomycetes sp. MPI-SDFR-AT-0126]
MASSNNAQHKLSTGFKRSTIPKGVAFGIGYKAPILESERRNTLEYQPLDNSRNEIRLLGILPQLSDELILLGRMDADVIRCTLENVSLDEFTGESKEFMKRKGLQLYKGHDFWDFCREKTGVPDASTMTHDNQDAVLFKTREIASKPDSARWTWGDFVALSYTWGSFETTKDIVINGAVVKVTPNLEEFLRSISKEVAMDRKAGRKVQRIWIDQLCINQNDIEERNLQVKCMGKIYEQASLVFVWLGKEDNDSKQAMDLLTQFGLCYANDGKMADGSNLLQKLRGNPRLFQAGSWTALERFLERPYWTRLWVIQEIALSHGELALQCGNQVLAWKTFVDALFLLTSDFELLASRHVQDVYLSTGVSLSDANRSSIMISKVTKALRLAVLHDEDAPTNTGFFLANLLSMIREAEQKDPRDKVYGVLSLLNDSISKEIVPDYNSSIPQIYTDFAKALIKYTGSVDIVCHATSDAAKILHLPSWVPDLTAKPSRAEMSSETRFHAGGQLDATVCSFRPHGVLSISGILIDTIESLGCPCLGKTEGQAHDIVQATNGPVLSSEAKPIKKSSVMHRAFGALKMSKMSKPKTGSSSHKFEPPSMSPTHALYSQHGLKDAICRTITGNRDMEGKLPSRNGQVIFDIPLQRAFESDDKVLDVTWSYLNVFRGCNGDLRIGDTEIRKYFPPGSPLIPYAIPEETAQFFLPAVNILPGRRFIISAKGYLGMVPGKTERGDVICVFLGSELPVVLRPCIGGYNLVGECYVHGIMEGEAMKWLENGEATVKIFNIV